MILIFPHLAFSLRLIHRQMEGWELENKRVSESEGERKGKGREDEQRHLRRREGEKET